jgi:hypothetical protein
MDSRNRASIIQAIIAGITIIAMTWGTRYNWPDFVHVKHGLPLTWGVHTLSTIVGPVDTWELNLVALTLDLALWLALILLTLIYLSRKFE